MPKTNLQKMRKRAGFDSAREFAEYMGIPSGTYTGWEQGRTITLEQAWDFADFFGCSLDELAGREWPPAGRNNDVAPDERIVLDAMAKVNDEGRARIVEGASLVAESARYVKSADERTDVQSA